MGEPELCHIRLYDLRHHYATMQYAKTKDIIYVQRQLGHRNIKNTLRYVGTVNWDAEEYVVKAARSVEDATTLIEQGFDYVTEIEGVKIFRKRK